MNRNLECMGTPQFEAHWDRYQSENYYDAHCSNIKGDI